MPPRSRKKAKTIREPSLDSDLGPTNADLPSDAMSAQSENVLAASGLKSFLSLPHELLLKIVDLFPKILPQAVRHTDTTLPISYKTRFVVLRALSQTCRRLRQFYLPLLWEHFEVCLTEKHEGSWYRILGNAMERKSNGMLASQHLWAHVHIVTVVFTRYKTETVLPPFVKLLQSLPNVHTLQIPHAHVAMTTALKNAFKGCTFPTIRTVTMPTHAHEILRCCPGVREITSNFDDGQKLVSALIAAGCSKLGVINDCSPSPTIMKRLAKANPPLRYIRVIGDENDIRGFSVFPSLRVIEIAYNGSKLDDYAAKLVQAAKEVLQECSKLQLAPKASKSRKGNKNTQEAPSDSDNLDSGPQIVKICFLPVQTGRCEGVETEEFLV